MIFKTRGIVFKFTRFRETSIIVTILTEAFGLQRYIVNGVRSKSSKSRIALFQPLTLLDMVVYHHENANIERIREVRCLHPYRSLATDVRKATMAMFIAELLNKSVKHESHAEALYAYISESLITIDGLDAACENAHLIFMIQLSRHLGFGPQFVNEILGGRAVDAEVEKTLKTLLSASFTDELRISNLDRRAALDLLIRFYSDHLDGLGDFKSVQVLREVLS